MQRSLFSREIVGILAIAGVLICDLVRPRTILGEEPVAIRIEDSLPYGGTPINYYGESTSDVITRFQTRLNEGAISLAPRGESGYLLDLLKLLEIDVESQSLVFSKTSVNQALIKPSSPRAIYFNDDVSVAWVPGAAAIEVTVQDELRGALFYTLPQPIGDVDVNEANSAGTSKPEVPQFRRDSRCASCHISRRTLQVPGHIVGSVLTDSRGRPREGVSSIDHSTPFDLRWGGWFVSGVADRLVHRGNLISDEDASQHQRDPSYRGLVRDLSSLVDLSPYPSKHSDVVAQFVLNHQMQFLNLVNRVRIENALNRRSEAEEQLVEYALMSNEVSITGVVRGSSSFAANYQKLGTRDPKGRSLRDLDLESRLFRYSLSPLIASKSIATLPAEVKHRIYSKIDVALGRREDLSAQEIARFTIPDWPQGR